MIRNDLYCPACGRTRKDVLFHVERPPHCPRCHTPMRQDWSHGHPPATDLRGTPRLYEGLDAKYSSNREAERAAKRRAADWTDEMQRRGKDIAWKIDGAAGDKKGGARDVRRRHGSAFSYGGQRSRISTGERPRTP